eukprot:913459-Rhodomonas_salina.1
MADRRHGSQAVSDLSHKLHNASGRAQLERGGRRELEPALDLPPGRRVHDAEAVLQRRILGISPVGTRKVKK